MLDKPKIVADIRAEVEVWHHKYMPDLDLSQGCFYWAVFSHAHLKKLLGEDMPVLISAGSHSFPRIDLDKDDGKICTHFSYMWEPNSTATQRFLRQNAFPEMHVWIQLPVQNEIFDITTRYLKQQCIQTSRMEWLAPDPPDFIWCQPHELPRGVRYEACPQAVQLVRRFVQLTWGA